jgi:hypothetical protein
VAANEWQGPARSRALTRACFFSMTPRKPNPSDWDASSYRLAAKAAACSIAKTPDYLAASGNRRLPQMIQAACSIASGSLHSSRVGMAAPRRVAGNASAGRLRRRPNTKVTADV